LGKLITENMTTYIAFLRGINVGGQKKIPMSQLKTMLESLGFSEVSTYIQSGNIVLKSSVSLPPKVSEIIREGIVKDFGFGVPVLVTSLPELDEIINGCPFEEPYTLETKKWYYVLLLEPPSNKLAYALRQEEFPNEHFVISEKCVYLRCGQGHGQTKCNNNFFEKKLKVTATTRNHRTMMTLLEMGKLISEQ
jgi:uncharacterized protein (DUF1697 family)